MFFHDEAQMIMVVCNYVWIVCIQRPATIPETTGFKKEKGRVAVAKYESREEDLHFYLNLLASSAILVINTCNAFLKVQTFF